MVEATALVTARDAMRRHAWDAAIEGFAESDVDGLPPEDAEMFAEALWWNGKPDEAVRAWERAFGAHVEGGKRESAAVVALKLAELAFRRGALSVGKGWLARADRLVEDDPDSVAHGWLAIQRAIMAMLVEGDPQTAESLARQALDVGRARHDAGLEALAMSITGTTLVRQGHWSEGLALIDEAATAASTGELAPKTACDVYCITISTCCEVTDYRRAGEWTEQADRWMEQQALRGYRGECGVHRAGLKRRRGAWSEAEQEAQNACRELEAFHLFDAAGMGHYEIGEVRLRMGDLATAEASFATAHELGRDPQPGMALLQLARGDVPGAAASIQRVLTRESPAPGGSGSSDLILRAQLLPAGVEIAIAAGDLEAAAERAEELEALVSTYESISIEASSHHATGAVALARGDATEAISQLHRAWRMFQQVDFPYEAARTRVLLGEARILAGDDATGRLELQAARAAFARLGATEDLRKVDQALGASDGESARRVRKTFMFTDIVTSTDMVQAIGDDAWRELLHWHDRVLREEFTGHRGEEVRHTGDGFFGAFEAAADAVRCAISIQRRLADHRRQHGFALRVRIGIHAADAYDEGGDYSGQGVHAAARISAAAEADEILVSHETYEAASPLEPPLSGSRQETFKGIKEPMTVHLVDWLQTR